MKTTMIRFVAIFVVLISADLFINVVSADITKIFINSLADRGISKLTRKLQEQNIETLNLPDELLVFRKRFPHVQLMFKDATFGSLYSLKRAGDVSLMMDGYSLSLNTTSTFENAVFHFPTFIATVGNVDLGDEVTIYVKKNQLHIQCTLLLTESGFRVNVDNVELTVFEDFHVERRKKGELQSDASNKLISFVLNQFHGKLRKMLSKVLKLLLENILGKYDLL